VIPVSEPLRGLDERRDRLVIGDSGVPIVDEEARGRFETHSPRGDGEIAKTHLRLERPA